MLYFASPIPDTFFMSSVFENLPFSSLYSIIFVAVDGPIPGSSSNSSCVALFIFISAFKNLMSVVTLFLERVPSDKDLDKIIESVKEVKGVVDVHHIHLWNIDEVNSIITMHIVSNAKDFVRIKCEVRKILDELKIEHATIEMEEENENCENYECKIEHHEKGHNH